MTSLVILVTWFVIAIISLITRRGTPFAVVKHAFVDAAFLLFMLVLFGAIIYDIGTYLEWIPEINMRFGNE